MTFNFQIYLSFADKLGMVELMVWYKNMLMKECLGKVALPLDDWFRVAEGWVLGFDNPSHRVSYALCVYVAIYFPDLY